jgi:hypothetical protein
MTEPDAEVDRLRRELSVIEDAFWEEYQELTTGWQFSFGPIRIRRHINQMFIVQMFIAFHILCFALGVGLIFTTGPTRDLGIALVVGSTFAFGSFLSQFLALSLERGNAIYKDVAGEFEIRDLRKLAEKREQLMNQIKQLERPDGSDPQPAA